MPSTSYRSTPVFTTDSLPMALRREHSLKAGVWGKLTLISGALCYTDVATGEETRLVSGDSKIIPPESLHYVAPLGAMEMRIDFYDHQPE